MNCFEKAYRVTQKNVICEKKIKENDRHRGIYRYLVICHCFLIKGLEIVDIMVFFLGSLPPPLRPGVGAPALGMGCLSPPPTEKILPVGIL